MGKHHRNTAKKNWTSAVTAGLAFEVVGLFGFTYATSSPVTAGVDLLSATTIFVDGTRDIIPTGDNQDEHRLRDALSGTVDGVPGPFDQCPQTDCGENIFISYPRDMGILTGLHSKSYDESKGEATQAIKNAIKDNPNGGPIYVVGYSQGADAAADALRELEQENATNDPGDPDVDLSNVTFVLVGNGTRNDGGIVTRMPKGIYVPLLGITLGGTTASETATVIAVNKQYDFISDAPKYVLNPVAWANSMLGFFYVHNGYYDNITIPDLTGDDVVDEADYAFLAEHPDALGDGYLVTKSENGKVIDVLVLNPAGRLPLTMPLLALGVPQEVVDALDPLLRAIIETGYDRPTDGRYPAEPVPLGLMPGLSQWPTDIHAVLAGFHETAARLAALGHPAPAPAIQVSQYAVDAAPQFAPAQSFSLEQSQRQAAQQIQIPQAPAGQPAPPASDSGPSAGPPPPPPSYAPNEQGGNGTSGGNIDGSPPLPPAGQDPAPDQGAGTGQEPPSDGSASDPGSNDPGGEGDGNAPGAGAGEDAHGGGGADDNGGGDGDDGGNDNGGGGEGGGTE